MQRSFEEWKKKSFFEKGVEMIGILCSVIVIVLGIIQIVGTGEGTMKILEPLLGVVMTTQGIAQWKKNRGLAIFSFGAAIFIFAVSVVIIFFR